MLRLAFAIACLLLVGCGPLWNAANRSSLTSDVRELLKAAAVVPQHLECTMDTSTRKAACSLSLSQSEAQSVIRFFALESIDPSSATPSPFARLLVYAGPTCVAGATSSLTAFGIAGRPKSLHLRSGGAFEYLLLTLNNSTGQACLQVSYSYG